MASSGAPASMPTLISSRSETPSEPGRRLRSRVIVKRSSLRAVLEVDTLTLPMNRVLVPHTGTLRRTNPHRTT